MTLLLVALGLILGGALAVLLLRRHPQLSDRLFAVLLPAGCTLGLWPAVTVLRGGSPFTLTLPGSMPGGPWAFGIDPLTAWFLIPLLMVGACAGAFGIGYLAPERGHRSVAGAHALFAVLLTAMVGVVTAQAVVPFLAAWEVMAVSAYLLVMFEYEQAEVRRAGLIYIVLTHLSTLALIGMFAALGAHAGGRTFAELSSSGPASDAARTLALAFALAGFGIKAGAVPLHFWLPGAHAAAPSHVSALLSGVMLKMGIYGLFRVLGLLGSPPPPWFGWTLFGLGLASGVLGVLWALAQHEMKRLLAYHSVENIGIILLGLGVGALGLTYGRPAVAVLGFTGALLHTLNHALFKGLLFLGAGAVLRATGIRMIDQLGGLARELPWTALAFGVGSIAIVGLPPLNGFVSEWVVFQGLLVAGGSGEAIRFAVVGAAGLGLIGALALACFAKLDAVVFLGQRRFPAAGAAGDPRPVMLAPMLVLALACIGIGLLPVLVLEPARMVALAVAQLPYGGDAAYGDWSAAAGRISALGLGLIAVIGAGSFLRRRAGRRAPARLGSTWGCAASAVTPRMQYTASSYAAPLLAAFGLVAGVRERREGAAFHSDALDPVLDAAVTPAWRTLGRASERLRGVQGGRLRWYLLLVIFTLLALLYYLAAARPVP